MVWQAKVVAQLWYCGGYRCAFNRTNTGRKRQSKWKERKLSTGFIHLVAAYICTFFHTSQINRKKEGRKEEETPDKDTSRPKKAIQSNRSLTHAVVACVRPIECATIPTTDMHQLAQQEVLLKKLKKCSAWDKHWPGCFWESWQVCKTTCSTAGEFSTGVAQCNFDCDRKCMCKTDSGVPRQHCSGNTQTTTQNFNEWCASMLPTDSLMFTSTMNSLHYISQHSKIHGHCL